MFALLTGRGSSPPFLMLLSAGCQQHSPPGVHPQRPAYAYMQPRNLTVHASIPRSALVLLIRNLTSSALACHSARAVVRPNVGIYMLVYGTLATVFWCTVPFPKTYRCHHNTAEEVR